MSDERKSVSDERILLEFLLSSDNAFFTSEFEGPIPLTRQQIQNRLRDMEEKGLVASKKASNRNIWWITDEGVKRVSRAARDALEE